MMKLHRDLLKWGILASGLTCGMGIVFSQEAKVASSYSPVVSREEFTTVMNRMKTAKPAVMKRQMALLEQRYDLGNRPAKGVTMTRGKAVQGGVRVKLPAGVTWERLAQMSPAEVREKDLFPQGFLPLPHPNHPEGGMLFARFFIDEIKKQEQRDLTRFDLDFDLPDHFLPEFPAAIFLTTRPDLGDVSKGSHDRQLLRAVQRHPEPEATGRAPAAGDAVSATAVQPDRRPAIGAAQPRRDLL
jgi:cytochrome c peroxidase